MCGVVWYESVVTDIVTTLVTTIDRIIHFSNIHEITHPLNSLFCVQVLFPDEDTPALIGSCMNVDISVHSNRFPATRFETVNVGLGTDSGTLPVGECRTRGSCRENDATIYVVPHCADGFGCNSACFPFCMAVRESGSGNNNLQLMGAARCKLLI